jgi:hypothetical protein
MYHNGSITAGTLSLLFLEPIANLFNYLNVI